MPIDLKRHMKILIHRRTAGLDMSEEPEYLERNLRMTILALYCSHSSSTNTLITTTISATRIIIHIHTSSKLLSPRARINCTNLNGKSMDYWLDLLYPCLFTQLLSQLHFVRRSSDQNNRHGELWNAWRAKSSILLLDHAATRYFNV